MTLGQSERWITPSERENNIGHDGRFGHEESYRDDMSSKPRQRARREKEGKYVPAMQERGQKDGRSMIRTFSPVTL